MKSIYIIIICMPAFIAASCKKDWLDAKPDKKLVVPVKASDLQAMLDNDFSVFNSGQPSLGEIASDDYYVLYPDWQALYTSTERNSYVWAKDTYSGEAVFDWILPYQRVFYENYILENVTNISKDTLGNVAIDNIKGSALFGRGFDFYSIADAFAKPFDSTTASTDLGIPIRLKSDINIKSSRSTVLETYRQIIADLEAAVPLLPGLPLYKTRPSKMAAYAMLARVYLNMDNYPEALLYADSSLQIQSNLIDYNSVDATAPFPFTPLNDEVIYHAAVNYPGVLSNTVAIVDSNIYRSYDTNDLRRYLFIDTTDGHPRFKGGYDGYTGFAGIATDEMYLLRAECFARVGNATAAVNDLNKLLSNRYKTGTFVPFSNLNASDVFQLILKERRKELLFRGLRWTDLRRLNKENNLAITLTRILNNQQYTLPPNDNRYVYPIPDQEIQASGIQQNPR